MTYPQPNYEITKARVESVLNRLRSMWSSISGSDNYNQGLREGVRSASMAMKEELDTTLIQTLSGPPGRPIPPPLADLLAWADSDELEKLAEAMVTHDVELWTLPQIAECEHEFEIDGTGPDGDDWYGDCLSCGVSREFLETMGWYLGEIACQFCSYNQPFCPECGPGPE